MSETGRGTPNRIDLGIEAFWPDLINHHEQHDYTLPAGCGYTIARWGSTFEPQFALVRPQFGDRLRLTALRTLGLLDADGRIVMQRFANA